MEIVSYNFLLNDSALHPRGVQVFSKVGHVIKTSYVYKLRELLPVQMVKCNLPTSL